MKLSLALLISIFFLPLAGQERELLRLERSRITFVSEAPLERITATNASSNGILDLDARTFAVQIPMVEFQGFNSPLQREHFNENYMLSREFPKATFTGRIIENVDLRIAGEHIVRAKGEFTLKGITRERIIPCKLVVAEEGIRVTAAFDVLLDEHEIRVPRVVQQKIATVVQVEIDALFRSQVTPK